MSQLKMDDFVVRNGKLHLRGPSDADSNVSADRLSQDEQANIGVGVGDGLLKKLKNDLWTRVLRVDGSNIERVRVHNQLDDVQNALTNVEVMAIDEHEKFELLFDADAFEAPPQGTRVEDLRLGDEELVTFINIAAQVRAGCAELSTQLQKEE